MEAGERVWVSIVGRASKEQFDDTDIEYIRVDIAEKAIDKAVQATRAAIEKIIKES